LKGSERVAMAGARALALADPARNLHNGMAPTPHQQTLGHFHQLWQRGIELDGTRSAQPKAAR
jgi:hypothetical protein